MGLFSRKEKRDVSSKDPFLAEFMGLRSSQGQVVTPETASGLPAVHACTQLIAETTASLPCNVYRRGADGGKEVDKEHPLYELLNVQSNPAQTSMEFREQFMAACLLTGNSYALKEMNGQGEITALYPLRTGQVQPQKLINGRARYAVTPETGGTETYIQDEVFHLRYRSLDGFTGLSPIAIARQTIELGLAQQDYESNLYKNGVMPSGILSHPGQLSDAAHKHLSESLDSKHGGTSRAGRTMVLEEGLNYQQVSMSQKDAEFIESRKLTLEDIARIYRVPPPSIGILGDATYSNITEQSRMLVMHCLRPWMVRIEKAMTMSLLSQLGRRTHFIEHNAEGLLRGNIKDRYEAYRIAREWGWMSVNEIRRKENEAGIGSDGEGYRQPMNSEALGSE